MFALDLMLAVTAAVVLIIPLRQIIMSILYWVVPDRPAPALAEDALPTVAIMIPAHNEERVIAGCLDAMGRVDYPADRLQIVVINDRSQDATGALADAFAAKDPRVQVIHRPDDATPGKPAALADGMELVDVEVFVFFDADYVPPPDLLRRLVAPFADPSVGATMGRVVPYNTDRNLLTKLIDLERRAGYVIDMAMRHRLALLPQFGGTCGAVRKSALTDVGGWNTTVLTEDTDLTYRLFIAGYRVAFVLEGACYEESPETWQVRFKQVRRWAYGHNECLFRFLWPTLTTPRQSVMARLDAAIVLLYFFAPVLAVISLIIMVISPALGGVQGLALFLAPAVMAYSMLGSYAPYFQITTAVDADGQPLALRALPLIFLSSFISLAASVAGFLQLARDKALGIAPVWDKTLRFRRAGALTDAGDDD